MTSSQLNTFVGYHLSPKKNRESIDANGLIPGSVGTDRRAKSATGVFMYDSQEAVEYQALNWADYDVYRAVMPVGKHDHYDPHVEDAFYYTKPIPASSVTRIGHVVPLSPSAGKYDIPEVHWSKEEHCSTCANKEK